MFTTSSDLCDAAQMCTRSHRGNSRRKALPGKVHHKVCGSMELHCARFCWSSCTVSAVLWVCTRKLALCAPWSYMCRGEVQLHSFLISALDSDKRSASPWPLYLCGMSCRYPSKRNLGGPQSRSGRAGRVSRFIFATAQKRLSWSTSTHIS
jgi:hypothetical protein